MGQTLYLIDGHSLIFQVFHAIPEMSAPDGRPTNAVFGFSRDLLILLEKKKPDFLICALDPPGPTFRDDLYPAYKATRAPMPDNLRPQIDMIREVIDAMGVPRLECPGFEADDVIATVADQAAQRGIDTFICSGDKDTRQLIGPHVRLFNIRKDAVFDADSLRAEWGIRPEQVVDLLALTGDTVDNVPGIEGVGPKTATWLLQEFGSLDGVLANVDRISRKKLQENLRAGGEATRLSRELVTLRKDAPVSLDWEAARAGRLDVRRLTELFSEFGFRRLTSQFAAIAPPAIKWESATHVADTPELLTQLVAALNAENRFSLTLLADGPHVLQSRIVGLGVSWEPGTSWYVPIRASLGDRSLPESDVLAALRPVLESAEHRKIGHDLKYQMLVLRHAGVRLAGVSLDTMVADYLLEAGERSHFLDQLAQRYLQHAAAPLASINRPGPRGAPFERLQVADAAKLAGDAADVALRVSRLLETNLRAEGLWELYESLEAPLIEVLAEMEFHGVAIDVPLLERLSREFAARLREIERKVYELAGGEFNIASPVQLRKVLYEQLHLPVLKKTQTGPSTDQEVLEALAKQHPLPALLIEHRQIAKLLGTYVDALPQLVDPDTGCVHAALNQVVAATGRLSSSDPNLQNVPIRTEQGRQIRAAFIPRRCVPRGFGAFSSSASGPGDWQILTADYSQIELRILAHFSADAELCRAFAEDQDIHSFVASQIYGLRQDEVTADMRRNAKTVNFGVVYGLSPFGLSDRLGISREEAEAFIDAYFAKYSGVAAFIRDVLGRAYRDGFVTTILGRRRRIAGVRARPGRALNQPEREAVNTVVQGSAADLIKMAMLKLHRKILGESLRSKMLLQIHDELVFESPRDEIDRLASAVTEEMTGAIALNVPLKVDVSVGPNWLDAEPWAGGQVVQSPTRPE
jgi:DNA polymerase-1